MTAFRSLLMQHRAFVACILTFALLMKILVPAGFMPIASGNTMIIGICSGTEARTMVVPVPGKQGQQDENRSKAGMPCAFSGLSMPSLAAVDSLLLALAILFILVAATRVAVALRTASPAYLRPPLRGPPITA